MKMIIDDKTIEMPYRNMTEEEFFDFCQANEKLPLERDRFGSILVGEPVTFYGGKREARVVGILYAWNLRTNAGEVLSSNTGFTLPNGAVRCPDGAWISNESFLKIPEEELEKFAHICPEFIIEIRSKTDRPGPLKQKMDEYMENGCLLAFLIDPIDKQAFVYRSNRDIEHYDGLNAVLNGETLLPGFELDLSLFV